MRRGQESLVRGADDCAEGIPITMEKYLWSH